MKLLTFHLEITSYHIQMEAQGGTMDGGYANPYHVLVACVIFVYTLGPKRTLLCCASKCIHILIYIYTCFGDDQGPSLLRHKILALG